MLCFTELRRRDTLFRFFARLPIIRSPASFHAQTSFRYSVLCPKAVVSKCASSSAAQFRGRISTLRCRRPCPRAAAMEGTTPPRSPSQATSAKRAAVERNGSGTPPRASGGGNGSEASAVGRHRELERPGARGEHGDQADDVPPREGLASGQPDPADAAPAQRADEGGQLGEREHVGPRGEVVLSARGHAVHARHRAPVEDRRAKVRERAAMAVPQRDGRTLAPALGTGREFRRRGGVRVRDERQGAGAHAGSRRSRPPCGPGAACAPGMPSARVALAFRADLAYHGRSASNRAGPEQTAHEALSRRAPTPPRLALGPRSLDGRGR